jgi:hypothetical protein
MTKNRFNNFCRVFVMGAFALTASAALADDTGIGQIMAAIEKREAASGLQLVVPTADNATNSSPDKFSVSVTVDASNVKPRNNEKPPRLNITTNFYLNSPTVDKRVFINHPKAVYTFSAFLDRVGGEAIREGTARAFKAEALERNGRWWLIYDNGTDAIAYNQSARDSQTVELKEWIYARSPNAAGGGSRYDWHFGAMGRRARLSDMGEGRVGLHHEILVSGLDNNNEAERKRILGVVRTALPGVYIDEAPLTAILEPVVYWTADGEKRRGRYDITDRNTLSITIDEPSRNYPLLIDPTLNYGSFLGVNQGDSYVINALAVDGELYAGGTADGPFSAGSVQSGSFSGGTEGFVVEISDTSTPAMAWLQWFGGTGTDSVTALAVTGDEIYVGGRSNASTNWETIGTVEESFNSTNALSDGWVIEVADGATPALVWMQWLGGAGNETLQGVAVNGDEIYAGGYSSVVSDTWGTAGSTRGTYGNQTRAESWVVEIADGAVPAWNWIHWIGGTGTDLINSLAVVSDEIYAGGQNNSSTTDWDTPGSFAGTYTASTEGWVVELTDGSPPTLSFVQWVGGSDIDQVNAIAVNGNEIYVGGRSYSVTSWETIGSGGGTINGTNDGFVAEIADAGPPTIPWRQWLGGSGIDTVTALAVTGDEVYAGGNSNSLTSWETVGTTFGTYTAGQENWVVEITDTGPPTVAWHQWIGGSSADEINALVVSGDEIFAGGESTSATSWETVGTAYGTFTAGHEGYVVKLGDDSSGSPLSLPWLQLIGGVGTDAVNALAVNADEIYAGGYSTDSSSWQTAGSVVGTFGGGQEMFVVEIADTGPPTVAWLQWLGSTSSNQSEYLWGLAVNGDEIYAAGTTDDSNGWEAATFTVGTFVASAFALTEGFVVEIADGGPPSLVWRYWFGGDNNNSSGYIGGLAVNGDEIYAAGTTDGSAGWETAGSILGTFNAGGFSEVFALEIIDGGPPSVNWIAWMGGDASESFSGGVVVSDDEIYLSGYVFGTTVSWDTVGSTAGTFNSGANRDFFVVEIADGSGPTFAWRYWLGGSDFDTPNALAVNGDEVYVAGQAYSTRSWDTVGAIGGTFSPAGVEEGFVVEIADGSPPTASWLQWLGGSDIDEVMTLAVNGDAVYAGGYSVSWTSWETVGSTYGTNTNAADAWVVEIADGATPTVNWLQYLGGTNGASVYDLAINASELYVSGSLDTSSFETVGSTAGTYNGSTESFVVEIALPATSAFSFPWLQWLGDYGGDTYIRALAVNADEIYAGGEAGAVSVTSAIAIVGGTFGNFPAIEGFVIEVADGGAPTVNWLQWLGGEANDSVYALAVNGDEIYAGGTTTSLTSWDTVGSTAGTFNAGGSPEGFVAEIADGASPSVNWLQWLGGGSEDIVYAVEVTGDEVYAGGVSTSFTSWETVGSTAGTWMAGVVEGFVVEIADAGPPTVAWRQWLGGQSTNLVYALALNGDEIYAGGNSFVSSSWDTVGSTGGTHNEGIDPDSFVAEINDAGPPTIAWLQWMGADDVDGVTALAVNGNEVYVGGYSYGSTSWETVGSRVGTFNGLSGQEGWVVEVADASPPTVPWQVWLGGDAASSVQGIAVNGDEIYASGAAGDSVSWETAVSVLGTHSGSNEGFVVEIADGGPPSIQWMQWLGGSGDDAATKLAITSDEIFSVGYLNDNSGWEVTPPNTFGPYFAFTVKISDDGAAAGNSADVIFYDFQF